MFVLFPFPCSYHNVCIANIPNCITFVSENVKNMMLFFISASTATTAVHVGYHLTSIMFLGSVMRFGSPRRPVT